MCSAAGYTKVEIRPDLAGIDRVVVGRVTEIVSIERDGADSARAALERVVGEGNVAVFPADTLYGLACDPLNAEAVERIHEIKGRREQKPSAVMYFSPLAMRELVSGLGSRTRDAVGALLPGPVTLVVANPERRYPLACREDPERLGVRLIEGPLAGAITPIFQTSANRTGERSAHTASARSTRRFSPRPTSPSMAVS